MKSVSLKLYDLYVLKPLWLVFIILALGYFLKGGWGIGVFLIVMLFLLGIIGQSLHPQMSVSELAKGTGPSKEEVLDAPKEIDPEEAYVISKASLKTAGLIALTTIILSWHHGLKWYVIIILGVVVGYTSVVLIPIYSALLIRRKLKSAEKTV